MCDFIVIFLSKDEGGYCFYGRTVMTPIKYHDYLCLSISRVVVRVADHGDSHGQAILGHGNVGLNAELDAIIFSTCMYVVGGFLCRFHKISYWGKKILKNKHSREALGGVEYGTDHFIDRVSNCSTVHHVDRDVGWGADHGQAILVMVVVKIEDCDMYQQDGHALLVIGYGYKDGRLYCVCKNSDSVEWGSNGYLKLDFSLLRNFYASREVYFKSLKQV
ncbi:hypothetical protein BC332_02624 [Capsicum chinense]|nr:hypothetical protein BC332_02624 [Capsicum chinense]